MASVRWLLQTRAGPLALDAWSGHRDQWEERRTMVVRRSAKKVGVVALEGEALKARKISFEAVIALRGARLEDAGFLAIVAAVAGFPLGWHWIKR